MTERWTFESMEALALYFDREARAIRGRVASASSSSQHVMRAEAHAYEQAAMIVRNSQIGPLAVAEPHSAAKETA